MKASDMVVVYTTCDVEDAEVVRGLLESNDIVCVVESSMASMIAMVGTAAAIHIMVEEKDFEAARELISEDRSLNGEEEVVEEQ